MSATVTALDFGPLRIAYDDRVLRPRPWTMAQSRWAAELLRGVPAGPFLELCTGAGQIGLAAAVLSGRGAVLVDASDAACELSRRNAEAAGLAERIDVRHGPMRTALSPDERFPLVLADPPYIPSGDTGTFPEDPLTAIDGGDDGLDLARECLAVAARHTVPGAAVLLQVRDRAQAEQLVAEVAGWPGRPYVDPETREVEGRGAVLLLRRR